MKNMEKISNCTIRETRFAIYLGATPRNEHGSQWIFSRILGDGFLCFLHFRSPLFNGCGTRFFGGAWGSPLPFQQRIEMAEEQHWHQQQGRQAQQKYSTYKIKKKMKATSGPAWKIRWKSTTEWKISCDLYHSISYINVKKDIPWKCPMNYLNNEERCNKLLINGDINRIEWGY